MISSRLGLASLGFIAVVFGLVTSPLSGQSALESLRTNGKALVPQLQELAAWCGAQGLAEQRDQALEAVLAFDPDNAKVRDALKYKKSKEGWTRVAGWKAQKTDVGKWKAEYEQRRSAVIDTFVAKEMIVIREDVGALDVEERTAILGTLLKVAPDDDTIRKANGEVKDGGEWRLAASVRFRERRTQQLSERARLRKEYAAPTPSKITDVEAKTGCKWTGAFETKYMRVAGTVAVDELKSAATGAACLCEMLPILHEMPSMLAADMTAYFFKDTKEAQFFLDHHPAVPATLKNQTLKNPLLRLGDLKMCLVSDNTTHVRLGRFFGDIGLDLELMVFSMPKERFAIHHGLQIYIASLACGRAMPWQFRAKTSKTAEGAWEIHLAAQDTDWLDEARKLIASDLWPGVETASQCTNVSITPAEAVACHAIVTFVLDGETSTAKDFMRVVRESGVAEAFRRVDHWSMPEANRRVKRFLAEIAPAAK